MRPHEEGSGTEPTAPIEYGYGPVTSSRYRTNDPDASRNANADSLGDKIADGAEELVGAAKERWGDLTDDERLEAEGRLQRHSAKARQVVDGDTDEDLDERRDI